jgi:hypothetical protein
LGTGAPQEHTQLWIPDDGIRLKISPPAPESVDAGPTELEEVVGSIQIG